MKYTENSLNILAAKSFSGIAEGWINKNLSRNSANNFETIVDLLSRYVKKEPVNENIFLNRREIIERKIQALGDSCDGVVAIGDPKFPSYRGNVKESDQPCVLFYKGDLSLLSQKNLNIAVIGVLNPDMHTEQDERELIQKLISKNAVIVSGLAQGCDYIAHHETLNSHGATVAILPSTLNNIIPAKHRTFAQEIVENEGLLISEYFDEPKSKMELSSRYIKRDRLQALFSDMVILSASYAPDSYDAGMKIDSGSRHAMEKAREYGIARAVIYHEDYTQQPKYDLNRKIMREDNKVIVINPRNITASLPEICSTAIASQADITEQGHLF